MSRRLSPAQQDAFNRDVVEALEALTGQGGSERAGPAIARLRTYCYHCRGDCGCAKNPYDDVESSDAPAPVSAAAPAGGTPAPQPGAPK